MQIDPTTQQYTPDDGLKVKDQQHAARDRCLHCGLGLSESQVRRNDEFCCSGCRAVYSTIHSLGLERYYAFRDESAPKPVDVRDESFDHFDEPEFQSCHVVCDPQGRKSVTLWVEGIHCAACVWLIEKLPTFMNGVISARVNFGVSTVKVVFDSSKVKLSQVALQLSAFGYHPHIVSQDEVVSEEFDRRFLQRLGVAAVCALNTMMLAVSLYQGLFTGIEEKYAEFFRWISFVIAIPSVTFSAYPFYKRAMSFTTTKRIHIDLPISLGIVLGFVVSAANTILGIGEVYFDSVTALVFLLLAGRWIQHRTLAKARQEARGNYSLLPFYATRVIWDREERVKAAALSTGDIVRVNPGEVIPVDGIVVSGKTRLDAAVLSGESLPIDVQEGSEVVGGTSNIDASILVQTTRSGNATRLGRLLALADSTSSSKPPLLEFSDKISAHFTWIVLTLAAITFSVWISHGLLAATSATIALLIVTCPCALALATPVSFAVAISKLSKRGIYVKNSESVERTSGTRTIFLDKTGVLTQAMMEISHTWISSGENLDDIKGVVRSLEQTMLHHPVARALHRWAKSDVVEADGLEEFKNATAVQGKGVFGSARSGEEWILGSERFLTEHGIELPSTVVDAVNSWPRQCTRIFLSRSSQVVFACGIGDSIRPEAPQFIRFLKERGRNPIIISGDRQAVVDATGEALGIDHKYCRGDVSPEEKCEAVAPSAGSTMMVGDGVNDAAALRAASVGVGMYGGAEACLENADIYIARGGLEQVAVFLSASSHTMRVIKGNLCFSLLYNIVGALAAMLGYVNPLFAAILMPLSSFTVLFASMRGLRTIDDEAIQWT